MEKIIEAAKQTGAEAIDLGYGFLLDKRVIFVEALKAAGIAFIGRTSRRIRQWATQSESDKAAGGSEGSNRAGLSGRH